MKDSAKCRRPRRLRPCRTRWRIKDCCQVPMIRAPAQVPQLAVASRLRLIRACNRFLVSFLLRMARTMGMELETLLRRIRVARTRTTAWFVWITTFPAGIRFSHAMLWMTALLSCRTSERRRELMCQAFRLSMKHAISTLVFRTAGVSDAKYSANCDSALTGLPRQPRLSTHTLVSLSPGRPVDPSG